MSRDSPSAKFLVVTADMAEETSSCPELWSNDDSTPVTTLPIRKSSYPLNSKRIVANQLQALAKSLELLTGASLSETRQLIEGRLLDLGYRPENVQVVVMESQSGDTSRISLIDKSGVILETGEIHKLQHPSPVSNLHNFNNNVCPNHTLHTSPPVHDGDDDALELRSALRDARRDNERLERVLNEQFFLLA